jgi:hypothetical protein
VPVALLLPLPLLFGLVALFAACGAADQFAGTWTAAEGYGGLEIEKKGDGYSIVVVMNDGARSEAMPTRGAKDGKLTFAMRATDLPVPQGPDLLAPVAKFVLTPVEKDKLKLELTQQGGTQTLTFVRAEKIKVAPSPSPTSAADKALDEATLAIERGIMAYADAHDRKMPPAKDVADRGAVATYMTSWRRNPYSGAPMTSGDGPGQYGYKLRADGLDCEFWWYDGQGVKHTW